MTAFRRILCPVDFSEPSERALDVAAALARDIGARITVFHVVETPDPLLEKAEFLEWITRRYEQRLKDFMARHRAPEILPAAVMLEGHPAVEIARHAEQAGFDLIVVGTHGRGGLARALVGSVAERVVRTSSVPVLTVPGKARVEKPEPEESESGSSQ